MTSATATTIFVNEVAAIPLRETPHSAGDGAQLGFPRRTGARFGDAALVPYLPGPHRFPDETPMATRLNFTSPNVPRTTDAYPHAVVAQGFVFVSGTPGFEPGTGRLSEHFDEQAAQAFRNLQTILEELGSGLDKIVKTTVFMVSGNDFGALNQVYAEVFPANPPARSTPQVLPFPGGILVSVECIALV